MNGNGSGSDPLGKVSNFLIADHSNSYGDQLKSLTYKYQMSRSSCILEPSLSSIFQSCLDM